MSARRTAWIVYGIIIGLLAGALLLFLMHYPRRLSGESMPILAHLGLFVLAPFVAGLGLVITLRRGGHPVAWTLLGSGTALSVMLFIEHYALQGLEVDPGSLPGATWLGWFGGMAGPVVLWVPMILLLAWFPTGRVPSPLWRIVPFLLAAACGLMFVGSLNPTTIMDIPSTRSPVRIEEQDRLIRAAGDFAWLFMTLSLFLAASSLVVRTIRSRGVERQQLKVVGLSAVMVMLGALLAVVSGLAGVGWIDSLVGWLAPFLIGGGLISLPIAVTVALLRYRLYDIDVVINRALVYGALTITLALLYMVSVIGLGFVLNPITRDSDVAVAGSTLAIAAAFRPMRGRLQRFIDKRFYRRRYDASQTLASFIDRLRNEVDLEVAETDLLSVVRDTVQPTFASLWLPDAGARS